MPSLAQIAEWEKVTTDPPTPTQPLSISTTAARATHFRFFDLSVELRNAVYEELVVVGKVFHSTDKDEIWHHGTYRRPFLAIFRVCKQMNAEAEPVYLSKKVFHLPVEWFTRFRPFIVGNHNTPSLFSRNAFSEIRNLHFEFSTSQIRPFPYAGF